MLLSYTIVDFYFYYNNGAIDMQICTLLTRIQCKVSDTQVTVKACGPLVTIHLLCQGQGKRVQTLDQVKQIQNAHEVLNK